MNLSNKNHPVYEPEKWNKDVNIKTTHNCYSYALNLINPKMAEICKEYKKINKKPDNLSYFKPQPGRYSGYIDEYTNDKIYKKTFSKCTNIEARMKKDNPCIIKLKHGEECPNHYYKIALYHAEDGTDYHFYRQDNTGLWSHKDGETNATNKDRKGRIIRDPETSEQLRKGGRYRFCGFFAVPISSKYKKMSSISRPYKDNISEVQKMINEIKQHKKDKNKKDKNGGN